MHPAPEAKAKPSRDPWRTHKGHWGWGKPEGLVPKEQAWDEALAERAPEKEEKTKTPKELRDEYLNSLEDKCFILGAPVEMCTPVMTQTTYKKLLRKSLHWVCHNQELHFGESMGLHVHVGCGEGSVWSLAELQAIGKGLILWEKALDSYHAPWRREGTWMCQSNRHNPELEGLTILETFAKIDRTTCTEDFYGVVGAHKFMKYNFSANTLYGTIEFRQAEAYAGYSKAIKWVHLISCLVSSSLLTEAWEWIAWARMVGMGDYNLLELDVETWARFGLSESLRADFVKHNERKWDYGDERIRPE
jgi:hypothetical protein